MDAPRGNLASAVESRRRRLHALVVVTACAVFPLVFVGAGVTSKEAGMAYPDGFTSNGYFLRNPPGWWQAEDTRWEHGHRLLGRAVGLLAIAVAVYAWPFGGAIRVLALCNLGAIVVQGVLGAMRVYEVSTALAMLHGVFGQVCFCLACALTVVTGGSWPAAERVAVPGGRSLQRLCLVGVFLGLVQLVSGAAVRHFGSVAWLVGHVVGAMAVTFLVGWIAMWVAELDSAPRLLRRLGWTVAALLVVQLLLGGLAFSVTFTAGGWSSLVLWAAPSAHVGTGALLLAAVVLVALCVFRFLQPAAAAPHERSVGGTVTAP